MVTRWEQDSSGVRPLVEGSVHSLSFLLRVSSSFAQGHADGHIWDRKSILLQKIGRDLEHFFLYLQQGVQFAGWNSSLSQGP